MLKVLFESISLSRPRKLERWLAMIDLAMPAFCCVDNSNTHYCSVVCKCRLQPGQRKLLVRRLLDNGPHSVSETKTNPSSNQARRKQVGEINSRIGARCNKSMNVSKISLARSVMPMVVHGLGGLPGRGGQFIMPRLSIAGLRSTSLDGLDGLVDGG